MTLHAVWLITGPRSASEAVAGAARAPARLHACVRHLEGVPAIVITSHIAWHRSPTQDMATVTQAVGSTFAQWEVSCGNELALEEIRHGEYTLEQAIEDGEFTRVSPAA